MARTGKFVFLLVLYGTTGCGGTASIEISRDENTQQELDADLAGISLYDRSPLFVEALAVSQRLDPSVDADACHSAFMEMVNAIRRDLEAAKIAQPDVQNREHIIAILNKHILAHRGVTYLSNRYWRDSLFTSALMKRQGNCLATSLLYHLVAEELDLPLGMQDLPGHVLVAWHGPGLPLYIETTDNGRLVGREMFLKQHGVTDADLRLHNYLIPLSQERVLSLMYHRWAHVLLSLRRDAEARELLDKAHSLPTTDTSSPLGQDIDYLSWTTVRNVLRLIHDVLERLDSPIARARVAMWKAAHLADNGELDTAIRILRAHYLDAPKWQRVEMMEQLGFLYRHKRLWGRAINLHRMQAEIDPSANSYNQLGSVYAEAHRDEEAIEAFEIALQYNSEDFFAQVMLAGLVERTGKKEEGRKLFAEIEEPREDKLTWYGALVWYYAVVKNEPAMLANMEKAFELDGSASTYRYFIREPDLDPYRDRPAFKALMQKYAPPIDQTTTVANKPDLRAEESHTEEEAIAEIRRLGGRYEVFEQASGESTVIVDFSDSQVSDEALEHLDKLPNLNVLHLSYTKITNAALESLQRLPSLEDLKLDHTQISDSGLKSLERLTNLEHLSLTGTGVTGTGLDALKKLKSLQTLHLDHTQVADSGLRYIEDLTDLQVLLLSDTQASSTGLEHLRGLKNLNELALAQTQITDEGLSLLAELPNLESLSLSGTRLTGAGLVHLKRLDKLQSLSLDNTLVTDDGLKHVKELENLKTLSLDHTQITDAGLVHLRELSHLSVLNLDHTQVTSGGLMRLRELPNLNKVHLSGVRGIIGGFDRIDELEDIVSTDKKDGAPEYDIQSDDTELEIKSPLFFEALDMAQELDPAVDADQCRRLFGQLVKNVRENLEAEQITDCNENNRGRIINLLNEHVLEKRNVTYLSQFHWRDGLFTAPLIRGKGNCLAISLLYHLVADELNLPLGIQFLPEHALVAWHGEGMPIYIEMTQRGRIIPLKSLLKFYRMTIEDLPRDGFLISLNAEQVRAMLYGQWSGYVFNLGKKSRSRDLLWKARAAWPENPVLRLQEKMFADWEHVEERRQYLESILQDESGPIIKARAIRWAVTRLIAVGEAGAAIEILQAHQSDVPKRLRFFVIRLLVDLYRYQGNWDRAIELCQVYLKSHRRVHCYNALGSALAAANRDEEAIEAFENALEYDDDNEFAQLMLAGLYARGGNKEKGRSLFHAVFDKDQLQDVQVKSPPPFDPVFDYGRVLKRYRGLVWYYANTEAETRLFDTMRTTLKLDRYGTNYQYFLITPVLAPYRDRPAFKALMQKYAPTD